MGLEREGVTRWDVEDSLKELRQLAATALDPGLRFGVVGGGAVFPDPIVLGGDEEVVFGVEGDCARGA